MEFILAKQLVSGYGSGEGWFGFNYNLNIYKGCNHGCIYCDSRSECYHVDNFDTVRAKEDALVKIEEELKSKRKKGLIGTGAMSDPYNSFEKTCQLTRGALNIIHKYQFGVGITTKSDLVVRDIDLLKKIGEHAPAVVHFTITTFDDELCQKIESHVMPSSKRFEAMKKLADEGIFTGVLLMPILPFINDTEANILAIVYKAKDCGAKFIYPAFGVTLRQNQRDYFYDRLEELFPNLKKRYIETYGSQYACSSLKKSTLQHLFTKACKECGLLFEMDDIIQAIKTSYTPKQLSLF